MPHESNALIAQLRGTLTQRRYNPEVVHHYCRSARRFLSHLAERKIDLEAVTPVDVSNYLRITIRRFRTRHGYPPSWSRTTFLRTGIHALLRLALNRWPLEVATTDAGELLCRKVCDEYERWLSVERGLAASGISILMWEARHFCIWYIKRSATVSFTRLNVHDVDAYMDMRAPGLTRQSLKRVAVALRSLLKHLHRTGQTTANLAPHVVAPLLYAYEGIPSALSSDQVATVLEFAGKDRSPMGLRDFAILQLLATYGLRAGEVRHLRLGDVDWRRETLCINHSKTGARSLLPLLEPVGEALLGYLRHGRPQTDVREIFVRSRAPYGPMVSIYKAVRKRIEAAGVTPCGKRGSHSFRHARAVSLLRASVPRKVIGDVLGHRSTASTIPYLKLATEDLRAIALEVPAREVRS